MKIAQLKAANKFPLLLPTNWLTNGSVTLLPWNGGMIYGLTKVLPTWWSMFQWMLLNQAGTSLKISKQLVCLMLFNVTQQTEYSLSTWKLIIQTRLIPSLIVLLFMPKVAVLCICSAVGWAMKPLPKGLKLTLKNTNITILLDVTFGMLFLMLQVRMSLASWIPG